VCNATIPAQPAGTVVKYIISAWHSGGGAEIFANGPGAPCGCGTPTSTPSQATIFQYTVTAASYTLMVGNSGGGTVSSVPAGIDCGATCDASFGEGTEVTLTATPQPGAVFMGWSGACSGLGGCTVTMDGTKVVAARFAYPLTVTRDGTGGGTVVTVPAGISCGGICSNVFEPGATVQVTAVPTAGSSFVAWGGACSGAGGCTVTMDAAKSVTATFQTQTLYWDKNGSTAGAGGSSPAGTWGTDSFWNSIADGTGSTGAWVDRARAVFSAGSDATGSFTVSLDGSQTANGLAFQEGTVTISGGTVLSLTGTGGVIDVASGASATIASVLGGTVGLT
jgi:hypothetical protein